MILRRFCGDSAAGFAVLICAMSCTEDKGEDFKAFCIQQNTFDPYQHAKHVLSSIYADI